MVRPFSRPQLKHVVNLLITIQRSETSDSLPYVGFPCGTDDEMELLKATDCAPDFNPRLQFFMETLGLVFNVWWGSEAI